jgi:hypothetical protein
MENPQKIEFKSLDDLVLFTTRRIGNRPSQHCPGMYAGLQREIGSMFLLLSSF